MAQYWQTSPYPFTCTGKRFRNKRWNHYLFQNDQYLFVIALAHMDYIAVIFMYVTDLTTHKREEKLIRIPLPRQTFLQDDVYADVKVNYGGLSFQAIHSHSHYDITFSWDEWSGHFQGELAKHSLNVTVPFSPTQRHFTSKHFGTKGVGDLTIGTRPFHFNLETTFSFYDYGRGNWPYAHHWNWLTAAWETDGIRYGINLGAGWTDGTGVNENALTINESLIKLQDDVVFQFQREAFHKTWSIESAQCALTFTPFTYRKEATNAIIVASSLYQFNGYLNGSIVIEDEVITVRDVITLCEDHRFRW